MTRPPSPWYLSLVRIGIALDYSGGFHEAVDRIVELEKAGIDVRLTVPHKAFNRQIGTFAGVRVAPDGRVVNENEWKANEAKWLPTPEDRAYVASLMGRVLEPGKFANWIAPPAMGINRQPIDFDYVRFN